jgi:hypothetical protein
MTWRFPLSPSCGRILDFALNIGTNRSFLVILGPGGERRAEPGIFGHSPM